MSKTWVFVINVWLFLYFLCLNAQSSVEIDGWNVSFSLVQRDAQQTVVRYVFTRSSQGAGPLERIVVGHPSCFPKIEILSAELSPSHTGYVVRESDGSVKLARTILTQAPFGVLAMIRDGSQNSYTLDIRYKGYLDVNGSVAIGVADLDAGGCSGGFCRGGKSRILNGVKCDVQTNNFCNASSVRADIAVFLDNSKFVSDSSLQTIKRAIQRFIENAENVTERPRIGVGRYWYGMITVENQSSHNCVINPDKNRCFFPTTQFAYDYYQATQRPEYLFANFVSLTEPQDHYPSCSVRDGSDGDFDKNFPDPYFRLCMDYDGFPRVNFGSQSPLTNLYRAVSDGYVCTGGDPSVDSALSVADQVLRSGWGDPQVPNVIILITSGRFLKTSSQVSTRCEASCLNQAAVDEALRVAQGIRQNGTRIFVVHFRQPNDPDLEGAYGCSESQKRLMEEALRSIASDGCYHRVEVNEVETALRSILSGLRFNYTCPNPSGNICSYRCVPLSTGGGRCEPVECPPTPTPTPRSCSTFSINSEKELLDEYLRDTKRKIREAERLMKGFSKNRAFRRRLESVYNSAARNSQRVFSAAWVKIFTLPDSFRVDRLEGNCIQSCQPQNWSGVKNELRDANSYIGNQALRVLSVRVPKKLSSKQKRKLSGMRARIRSLIDGYTPFLNQRVPDVACFG